MGWDDKPAEARGGGKVGWERREGGSPGPTEQGRRGGVWVHG